jgi:hypothetical protein
MMILEILFVVFEYITLPLNDLSPILENFTNSDVNPGAINGILYLSVYHKFVHSMPTLSNIGGARDRDRGIRQGDNMSVSQIFSSYSTALTVLQQVGRAGSVKKASSDANDLIKTANGISTTPSSAAKQASGVAFSFTVSQSQRDEAEKAETPTSIVIAGIGGGEAVERFGSWEAVEARIRTDGTMSNMQKSEWLDQVNGLKKAFQDVNDFRRSDLGIALESGDYQRARYAAINDYLNNCTSAD